MARLAILVSHDGPFMRPLLDSVFFQEIKGLEIAGIVSSSPTAPALMRARNMKKPCYVVDWQMFPNAASYGVALQRMLKDIDTDFIVLDGFVPPLGQVAKAYAGKILGVNIAAESERTVISVYSADQNGEVGELLAETAAVLDADESAEAFDRRVKEQSFSLLMGAIKDFCEK